MEQLVQTGEVRRGRIGVATRELGDRAQADEPAPDGVVIAEVVANSPAAQAGIEKGDIGLTAVGQHLRITFARGGIDHTVSVEVAAANDNTGTIPAARRR
jgi:serine protease Do